MTVRLFEVGGAVRDKLLGIRAKDVDFAVEAPSFEAMQAHIEEMGLKIFLSKPEFLTIRAGVPKGHALRERCRDADFVLCRKDGPTLDGRRPAFVEPGTIIDDLARRDFTVNAMALDIRTGEILDPHGGQQDLKERTLSFVGEPMARIREDGLRVLRAFRFAVTKGLTMDNLVRAAVDTREAAQMLKCVSVERMRDELEKMFAHDTLAALREIDNMTDWARAAIFRDRLRLSATLKS